MTVPHRASLVVLVSGGGTLLQALLDASLDPSYPAEVVAVGADRAGTGGVARAVDLPAFVVRPADHADRAAWDRELAVRIGEHRPDWIVSAGFMRLLGPCVLASYPDRVVNTHPALLPAFPGAHAVRDALSYGARVTGATIHLVDAGVDTGPILAQVAVPVESGDDVTALHERIKVAERALLVDTVAALARHGCTVTGRRATIP